MQEKYPEVDVSHIKDSTSGDFLFMNFYSMYNMFYFIRLIRPPPGR